MSLTPNAIKPITGRTATVFIMQLGFLLCAWGAAYFSLSVDAQFPFNGSDKINHILGYAGMTWLAFLGWPRKRKLVALIALSIGLSLELIQIPHPTREFAFSDLAANLIGIIAATIIAWAVKTIWVRVFPV